MSLFDSKDNNPESVTIDAYSGVTTDASSDSDVTNTEAINIETVAGLGQFLKAVEQVYDDASLFEEDAKDDGYQKLKTIEIEGDKVYDSLQDKFSELKGLVDECRYEVLPKGEELSDEQFERLQVLYNEMVSLRNLLINAYSIDLVEESEESEAVIPKTKFKPYVAAETVELNILVNEGDKFSGDEVKKIDEVKRPDKIEEDVDIIDKDIVALLLGVKNQAKDSLQYINDVKIELHSLFSGLSRTEEVVIDLSELTVSLNRAEKMVIRLENIDVKNENDEALKIALEKYKQIFIEIVKNVEAIKVVLLKKHDEGNSLENETPGGEEVVIVKKSISPEIVQAEKVLVTELNTEKNKIETKKLVSVKTFCDEGKTESGLPLSKRRCEMFVIPDNGGDGNVSIIVAKKTEVIMKEKNDRSKGFFTKLNLFNQVRGNFVPKNISNSESRVVAKTELDDPVNKMIPNPVSRVGGVESVAHENSLTRKFLNEEPYRSFIEKKFHSPENYDRILGVTIAQIEAKSTDAIERWLNEKNASPFDYLRDMKLSDVEKLSLLSYDEIKQVLSKENIKYDSLVVWLDILDEMKDDLDPDLNMEFGELFTKWMIIIEMENQGI